MRAPQFWTVPLMAMLAASSAAMAQEADEHPMALILSASRTYILRSATLVPLTARPGTILFAGDALRSDGGSATFVSCPGGTQQTLSPDGDVLFEARGPRVRRGRLLDAKPTAGCFLPALPRNIIASRQDAGAAVAREVSRDLSAQSFSERLEGLPPDRRNQLNAAIASVDAALKEHPDDPVIHLARAELLNQYGLSLDAAEEMKPVIDAWPDAGWARSHRFALEQNAARGIRLEKPMAVSGGNTYALLVGISKFQSTSVDPLNYADADAIELRNLLESPRAGEVPDSNIVLLTNKEATRGAIQAAIETHLLARAGKNDTVLLFIASHGAAYLDQGYVVAYDSDPKDLATTGIPMGDIKKLFEERLSSVKRLLLYVDVCRAGKIGEVEPKAALINKSAETALAHPSFFGMLASQSTGLAYEGSEYGGGHGAFSYFLMSALNGKADESTGKVTMDQLSLYVQNEVFSATNRKQHPKPIGDSDDTILADVAKRGIDLPPFTGLSLTASRGRQVAAAHVSPAVAQEQTARDQTTAELVKEFEDSVLRDHILPSDTRSAFPLLAALRGRLGADEYRKESEILRVALENRGQQVLIRYLAGEALPQDREEFLRGNQYFEAAESLAPDSVYLQSRRFFCQGRVAIFDKNYAGATLLLERAVGLDPQRAYAYNALGIAYLEQGQYDRAIPAFRDAASRAPYWAYPLHNMALAYAEKGDYANSIQIYRRAMQLAPGAVYLPYNLGLLYQRTNRSKDAGKLYDQALKLDPGNARVWTAKGALQAAAGKTAEAEKFYTQALQLDPTLLAARYDLAMLLSADSKRLSEAVGLLRDNLSREPKDLPSRLALAGLLAQQGGYDEAAKEYEAVLAERPAYVAARLALADARLRTGRREEALAQLQEALKLQPDNWEVLEKTAQVYADLGRAAEAKAAYEKALRLVSTRADRKRIAAASQRVH